ncbi:MAG: HAD-IA family hydrolase [Candidatus Aegiribacteria sp.]|nr:HAD-IA family hydrolase [Candidatus Aegiribacteria sp.]MBD3295033.1 HAD-IA family hydrolase [Candidatus Fermentibacteria bacterium]
MNRTVIFDLDGTLHHTEKALLPAIHRAVEEMGAPAADSAVINSLYGEPLEVFCRILLGGRMDICSQFRDSIRKHQKVTLPETGALYSGTVEMLDELNEMGLSLCVCSNAGLDYIELVTVTLGIRDRFSCLSGIDGDRSKKERVGELVEEYGKNFAVMVGDRYHDVQAAESNGIYSIGCLYGYGKSSETALADRTVNSAGEITQAVRELLVTG